MSIKKAVFPVAGLGTRFLPATKVIPKEMLPLVDKPLVQYSVEEAVSAGINQLILITAKGKRVIEDYFDRSFELESTLRGKGLNDLLDLIVSISEMADFVFVRQREPKGLGHAILCAKPVVEHEYFAIFLADDVIIGERPAISFLLDVHERFGGSVIALEEVSWDEVSRYGVVKVEEIERGIYKIVDLVEKPKKNEAPSNLAIIGRYILSPKIFNCLERVEPGAGGEIQLTDAMRLLLEEEPIYGVKYKGKRYDCGTIESFIKATVELALRHNDFKREFKAFLENIMKEW
ncbi:MAG: UTP--glucose-1-phosphate uridylyltransferase GalU [Synergistetes bacterium]|nr:UTP--glucose-1-phosphate uridylyltransferase GalU [Synergistota bacterium]MCX8127497.1 UTP--glucose-1-phosphate uridylyltransferase GalU [Synergistota bacterium]MDW8192726.1 UTP--glucose-1-phosphate uridylyltransferase GalU [Synergistota bacterium]